MTPRIQYSRPHRCSVPGEDHYEGETNEDGEPHGLGVYEYADGGRYEGGFKDGERHGHGVFRYPDWGRYEGGWKDGKMHGHGVKTDPQGNIFEGDWKDGKPVLGGKQKGLMDMLPWFNEEPGGVAPGTRRHGEYSNVATHDPDDM